MGIVICSILEYLTSYFMEKIFHAPFGLLGLFIMYVSNPFFFDVIEKIPNVTLNIICVILLIIYFIDNIISFNIIRNVNITSQKIKDNTEEITEEVAEDLTKKVKEILERKSVLHRRLIHAFPEMKMKIKSKIEESKEKMKKVK